MQHFTRVSADVIHPWAMYSLVHAVIESPSGEQFHRTFVDSPGAVGVVAITEDRKVVLVTQYRAAMGDVLTEIPAGLRDVPGEEPLVTAQRELAEEAGLEASDWQWLGRIASAPGVTNSTVEIFLARGLTDVPTDPHGPEEDHMTISYVPLSEAVEEVVRGRLSDSKTSVGLLLADKALRDGTG
ncbi:MAG: NUDIX domain-containing protein [Actinomycetota bacterium]